MSVSLNISGGYRSEAIGKPSTTSKTAISTGGEFTIVCLSLRATNSSGGGVNIQIHFYDDSESTEAEIYPTTSVGDGATSLIDLGELALDRDDELRVTVGTADALDLVFTHAIRRGGNG